MPKTDQVNWQPISQMPLVAAMITDSLNDTREHLGTLVKAKDRPHVLDDATIDSRCTPNRCNTSISTPSRSPAGGPQSRQPFRPANWIA